MLQYLNYILLDSARMGLNMSIAKQLNHEFVSLYRGESEIDLEGVAPYLFTFKSESLFSAWIGDKGWGDSWGVLLRTPLPIQEVQKHFRKFLMVQTEDGEELYFRFYDPRVLRIFLPTCDRDQLFELFGRIDYFICESEDPEHAIKFWHENGQLKEQLIPKQEILFPEFNQAQFDRETKVVDDEEAVLQEAIALQKKNELNQNNPPDRVTAPTEAPPNEYNTLKVETPTPITQEPGDTNRVTQDSKEDAKPVVKSKWKLFD